VAVKIKLKRLGKMRNPQYRIVVADARTKRDGRAIEEIGTYQPKQDPSLIIVDSERARYWLSVGAQPTEAVAAILRVTGDWQAAKGLPGAEGTLKAATPRVDKKAAFEAAAKESADEPKAEATTARTRKSAATAPAEPAAPAAEAAAETTEAAPAETTEPTAEAATEPATEPATEASAEEAPASAEGSTEDSTEGSGESA
jgi:small subunit ribosomal protein S16